MNSFLKILKRKKERSASEKSEDTRAPEAASPQIHGQNFSEFPSCTVYTKLLGADFPVKVCDLNPYGATIASKHEIFRQGEYVVLKMAFEKMTVSVPGRVVRVEMQDSEVTHQYVVKFHRS